MKPRVSRIKHRFLAAGILICLVGLSGYCLIDSDSTPNATPASEDRPEETFSRPEQVQPGWWETSDEIYFGIPARILFRLKEGTGDPTTISRQAWTEFDRIGKIFNPYDPGSETARLNAAKKNGPVTVSEELFEILKVSERLWRASNGAFDPTTFPVKKLWSRAVENQEIPSKRKILSTLSSVGFDKIDLLEQIRAIRYSNDRVQFDFGAVAKGYAVDRVLAVLEENEITDGLVQLGGEVSAFGDNDGKPWRIGIQHPKRREKIHGIISAGGRIRVSSSGNYRQPLIIAGHKFYHIFSPKTGMPVSEKVLGVTTASMSPDSSNAVLDGAATAITVMGAEEGIKLASELGIGTLILTEAPDGRMEKTITPELEDLLREGDVQR